MEYQHYRIDYSNLKLSQLEQKAVQQSLDSIISYDLYDIKSKMAKLYQTNSRIVKLLRNGINFLELLFPRLIRKLCNVKKQVTSASLAAIIIMLCEIPMIEIDNEKLLKQLIASLRAKKVKLDANACGYGLPLQWAMSNDYISKVGLPNCHTSILVGTAYLSYYKLFKDSSVLIDLQEIAEFICEYLPKKNHGKNAISISYTPFDSLEVINVSAEAAAFLSELAILLNIESYNLLSKGLLSFVLKTQRGDGAWWYSAQSKVDDNDNYHTMMNLRALLLVYNHWPTYKGLKVALEIGLQFYLNAFFDSEGVPKTYPDKKYPIAAYTCAESLYGLSVFYEQKHLFNPEMQNNILSKLLGVYRFISNRFMDSKGRFITRKYRVYNYKIYSCRRAQAYISTGLILFSKLDI